MSRRKSPLVSALFKLTRAGVRQSARIGQAAARQGVKAGGRLAEQAGRALSAVAVAFSTLAWAAAATCLAAFEAPS